MALCNKQCQLHIVLDCAHLAWQNARLQKQASKLAEWSVRAVPGDDPGGRQLTRRTFARALAIAAALPLSLLGASQRTRTLKIGHTGITWPNNNVEQAIKDIAGQGFFGFETFGNVLETWESQGGLGRILDGNNLPLISGYCSCNLTDADKRQESIDRMLRWAGIIKKYGGKVVVVGPNSVGREHYDFNSVKGTIVETLNEVAKRIVDTGLTPVLHQHTGTCVESRDETYAVLESVDTRYLKFGPDIGQLTKGGSDAAKVVQDFLPIIEHMHLKDFNGLDPHFLGYCPLGQGKVDIRAILDLMDGKKTDGMIMVELDNSSKDPDPRSPVELVQIAKGYLEKQGVQFLS